MGKGTQSFATQVMMRKALHVRPVEDADKNGATFEECLVHHIDAAGVYFTRPMFDKSNTLYGPAPYVGGVSGTSLFTYPFTFNTPGLSEGVPFFTPQEGDVLVDGWIEIDEPWDGTTPLGDFGALGLTSGYGWMSELTGALDMTQGDQPDDLPGISIGTSNVSSLSLMNALFASSIVLINGGPGPLGFVPPVRTAFRLVPARFSSASPIQVVVSQNGSVGGGDPGSTQGSGSLNLLIAGGPPVPTSKVLVAWATTEQGGMRPWVVGWQS